MIETRSFLHWPAGWHALTVALALLIVPVATVRAEPADPIFPALTGDVVDDAHVLSPRVRAELTGELADFRHATGHRLVVATVASLQGREIADYGIGLFRNWKVGRRDADDGAILLIAPRERRSRIQVGYQLEPVLTDAASGMILRGIHAKLAARDYDGAALDGAHATTALLKPPANSAPPPVPEPDVPAWIWAIFLGFAGLFLGSAWLVFIAVRAAIRSARGARAMAQEIHERAASRVAGDAAFAAGASTVDFSQMAADFEARKAEMQAEQERLTTQAMAMVERARAEGRSTQDGGGKSSFESAETGQAAGPDAGPAPAEPAWPTPPDPVPASSPTQSGWDPSPPVPPADTSFPEPPAPPPSAPDDSSRYTGGSAGGGGASDSW